MMCDNVDPVIMGAINPIVQTAEKDKIDIDRIAANVVDLLNEGAYWDSSSLLDELYVALDDSVAETSLHDKYMYLMSNRIQFCIEEINLNSKIIYFGIRSALAGATIAFDFEHGIARIIQD